MTTKIYPLTKRQKALLLLRARTAVESRFAYSGSRSDSGLGVPPLPTEDPIFDECRGLFVTLFKNGELRGCIGTLDDCRPLGQSVFDIAVQSAFDDPRFLPLRPDEYPNVRFEISLLSPLERVRSSEEIIRVKHGVCLRKNGRSGVFLPQVWEDLPDKAEFLDVLCGQKMGLEAGAWRLPGMEFWVFTVEKISESDGVRERAR